MPHLRLLGICGFKNPITTFFNILIAIFQNFRRSMGSEMLANQRHEQILSLLEKHGTVRTIDLAETFQVTDETVRRDLNALSEDGQLIKVHGGASSLSGRPKPQSFIERSLQNPLEKEAIAREALKMIEPKKTYAFDSSTTAMSLVAMLPDDEFRVVSNAFAVFEHLAPKQDIEIVSTGGTFHKKTRTFVNGNTLQSLRRYHVDIAFISCIGFNYKAGAGEGFEEQAIYKELLVSHADEVVLMVDSSKFGRQTDYYFASCEQVKHIITDDKIDSESAQKIRDMGIALTIA